MKKLTAILCLTIAVLLRSYGISESADYQKGLDAANSGDFATALREWKPLAEQGNADAQTHLGAMYLYGVSVPQDYETAVKWFKRAAKQGNNGAQNNLGAMYGKGLGVKKNYVCAHMWWNIAASSGYKLASKYRDNIAKKMTPSQVEKAQKLARECVRKRYKDC